MLCLLLEFAKFRQAVIFQYTFQSCKVKFSFRCTMFGKSFVLPQMCSQLLMNVDTWQLRSTHPIRIAQIKKSSSGLSYSDLIHISLNILQPKNVLKAIDYHQKYTTPSKYQQSSLFRVSLIETRFEANKIILLNNKINMIESRISNHSSQSTFNIPKREQWALIYQHRAMQLEKAKSMEKMMIQQKRDSFKKQLDNQLQEKYSKGAAQKEQDRIYYEYIVQKAQQMKEKQEKSKFQKYVSRRQMQQHNKHVFDQKVDPKLADAGKIYNIQIGLKSQMEKKQRAEAIKKDVIQTLDKQKFEKIMERQAEKEKELLLKQKNEEYQTSQFENRGKQNKKYQQNINVYNHYRDLYQKKLKKDRELQHKFVDQVQQRKLEADLKKKEQETSQKERRSLEMKDTLSRQVQLINHRKEEDKLNPQHATYSFINNIFRQKKPAFDKQEYSLYLEKQAEEQRKNKIQQKYMNDEQYRLNANQLNKAINGSYTFDNYQDRSMVTLGDKINMAQVQPLQHPDTQLVRNKLYDARSIRRGRSLNNSALQ